MSNAAETTDTSPGDRPATWIALGVLAIILILAVPQFLRMPLTNDPVYYDLQANNVLHGGVLYRDMAEPNLPGVVWLHIRVRALLGPSSEAIRFADLLIFASSILVLCRAILRTGGQTSTAIWAACGMFWCYLSLHEWSQVQRDPWLLLPAGLAMWLRERQIGRMRSEESRRYLFLFGLLEGIVWGAGVWIKPHIIIPAAIVWFASAWLARRVPRSLVDLAGLIARRFVYRGDRHSVVDPHWRVALFLGDAHRLKSNLCRGGSRRLEALLSDSDVPSLLAVDTFVHSDHPRDACVAEPRSAQAFANNEQTPPRMHE